MVSSAFFFIFENVLANLIVVTDPCVVWPKTLRQYWTEFKNINFFYKGGEEFI
jgi:hypothetical protein